MRALRRAPLSLPRPHSAAAARANARAAGVESTYAEKTATVTVAHAEAASATQAAGGPGERASCEGKASGRQHPRPPLYLSASRHSTRFRTKSPPSSNVRESAGNSFPLVSSRSEHAGESSVYAKSSQAGPEEFLSPSQATVQVDMRSMRGNMRSAQAESRSERVNSSPNADRCALNEDRRTLCAGRETFTRKVFRVSRLESLVFRKLALGQID